jgi:hypothetical protein
VSPRLGCVAHSFIPHRFWHSLKFAYWEFAYWAKSANGIKLVQFEPAAWPNSSKCASSSCKKENHVATGFLLAIICRACKDRSAIGQFAESDQAFQRIRAVGDRDTASATTHELPDGVPRDVSSGDASRGLGINSDWSLLVPTRFFSGRRSLMKGSRQS